MNSSALSRFTVINMSWFPREQAGNAAPQMQRRFLVLSMAVYPGWGLRQVSPVGLTHCGTIPGITVLFLNRGCLQKSSFFGVLGEAEKVFWGFGSICEMRPMGWGWPGWWGWCGAPTVPPGWTQCRTGMQCLQGGNHHCWCWENPCVIKRFLMAEEEGAARGE